MGFLLIVVLLITPPAISQPMTGIISGQVIDAETEGASIGDLAELLGSGRCKKGVFDGDLIEGELEIGQIGALLHKEESAAEIINDFIESYNQALLKVCKA